MMRATLYRVRFWSDHRWARARMSGYLDGELSAERRPRMERHLHECEDCRRLLADLRGLLTVLRRMRTPQEGVDAARMAASVLLALEGPPGRR